MPTTFDEDERTDKKPGVALDLKKQELASLYRPQSLQENQERGTANIDKNTGVQLWNFNSDDANKLRDDANSAEQKGDKNIVNRKNEDSSKKQEKGRSLFNGKSAAIALATGGTSLFMLISMAGNLFGSLMNNIAEILKNENTSSRTNTVYHKAVAAHQFTKGKCTGKLQIHCRFSNLSERRIEKLSRAGFTVFSSEKDMFGRAKVIGFFAPDGTAINNGRELHEWANASRDNARLMNLATKGKAAFWWNQKYNDVQQRWGIDKAKKLLGINREELDRSLNQNTNGAGDGDEDIETRARREAREAAEAERDKAVNDAKSRVGKAGMIAAVVAGSCSIYNMSHKLTAYAKNYHIEQMIKYANVFLNTADRIKDQGDVEPEVISYAGKILTDQDPRKKITVKDKNGKETEIDNPDYGKAATDSLAYETVTHGDTRKVSGSASKFRPGGYDESENTSWLGKLDQYTKAIEIGASGMNPSVNPLEKGKLISSLFGAVMDNGLSPEAVLKSFTADNVTNVRDGRQTIRYACIAGEDAAVQAFVVMCGLAFGALFTGVGTAPGAGTLASCGVALGCEVGSYVFDVCGKAMNLAIDMIVKASDELGLTDKLLEYVQSTALGSFTKYTDAGSAIGVGNAFLAESTSMAYGLRPAKNASEVQRFVASTNSDISMEESLAYEDAHSTPFDITNRYSFLSTAVRQANLSFSKDTPLYSTLLSAINLIPRTLSYTDTTYANYSQPLQSATERYTCDDPDLVAIGITNADKFCSTVGITPEAELVAARQQALDTGSDGNDDFIAKNLDYMTTEQVNNEDGGGTYDDSFCEVPSPDSFIPGINLKDKIKSMATDLFSDDSEDETEKAKANCAEHRKKSKEPSVDETGKTIPGSQYDMYVKYCTEQRKDPWGTFSNAIQEAVSNRDIDWWTGEQCLKDTPMMQNFRTYHNICAQLATMDDTKGCWTDEPMDGGVQSAANVTNSECASNGDTTAIYTCALKYDNYGYKLGGGHGDIPNAQAWIAEFKTGAIPEWTPILDCSGLVRVAFVEAMGIEDQAYVAPGGYDSSKYWEKIPLDQARQGDIVTSSGHVAIIEANDPAGKTFKIFHASTSSGDKENNIKHGTQSYGESYAAYRARKVTSV